MVDVPGQAPRPSPQGCRPALRTASHPAVESESLGKRPVTVSCRSSQARSQKETRSSSVDAGRQARSPAFQRSGSVCSTLGTLSTWETSRSREGLAPFQGWTRTISDSAAVPEAAGGTARMQIQGPRT